MPRISKKRREENQFFLSDKNHMTYNELCRKCKNPCEQSFRATVVECLKYASKRAMPAPIIVHEKERGS